MSTNYIDQITDTAGTTHDISEGDSTRIFRATCATAAATTAKVATLQTSDRNFSLAAGARVAVTFTYGNTAATPTLNVNSTGAKQIAVATSATAKSTGNGTTYNTWGAYETVLFTYDGTYWVNGGSSRSIYNAYNQAASAGTGTVTSVGLANMTNGGLTISDSPITTSGTINVGHTNILTNAQTTQAVYPIAIDKNGHISSYGNAVTIPTVPGIATNTTAGLVKPWYYWQQSSTGPTAGTVNSSATVNARSATAGRYYPIEIDKDGRMFVNVPWTNVNSDYITTDTNTTYTLSGALSSHKFTSTLTPSSGTATTSDFTLAAGTGITITDTTSSRTMTIACSVTNTDEKVTTAALTSGTTYYPILATGTGTATRQIDSTIGGLKYVSTAGTTSAVGTGMLYLGNTTASGTANNEQGVLRQYGTTAYYHDIKAYTGYPVANRTIYLPRYAGTMYLTCVSTTSAVGGSNNPVYVNNTGRILAGNTFVPNTGGSFTGDVSMAGTTAYTTANVKNIVESTDAPGTASDYPTGTVWLQYGASPPADRADYVVEQGASGIWTYRKWNSGISECWGSKTFTGVNVSTAWGNIYYGTVTTTSQTTYPSGLFLSTPISQFNLRSSGGRFWYTHQIDSSATNVGQIYAIAPTSYTNQSIDLQVYSMGKWK